MTIRILQAWNGYPQQAVVSMSASEETRLVGLGIASFDLDGPADNVRMAQIATAQKLYCCPVLPLSIRHFFLSTPPSAPHRFSAPPAPAGFFISESPAC